MGMSTIERAGIASSSSQSWTAISMVLGVATITWRMASILAIVHIDPATVSMAYFRTSGGWIVGLI